MYKSVGSKLHTYILYSLTFGYGTPKKIGEWMKIDLYFTLSILCESKPMNVYCTFIILKMHDILWKHISCFILPKLLGIHSTFNPSPRLCICGNTALINIVKFIIWCSISTYNIQSITTPMYMWKYCITICCKGYNIMQYFHI